MATIGYILLTVLNLYIIVLIARIILSLVHIINPQWTPGKFTLVIAEGIYTLTDPPLRWLRKLIKPLRIGNVSLDMAMLVLFLLVNLCMVLVQWSFF